MPSKRVAERRRRQADMETEMVGQQESNGEDDDHVDVPSAGLLWP